MDCLKQWMTKELFSRQEQIYFADCDPMGRGRLGVLLGKISEVSGHDYDARGWSHETMTEAGQAMLLSRLAIKIHRAPRYGEILTFTTWFAGVRGTFFRRYYEIVDSEGHFIVSGKSDWLLVNPQSRKIVKPRNFIGDTNPQSESAPDCPECDKITFPSEGCSSLGKRPVVYSDLDKNGHLFSGRYGDIFWDFLPGDLQSREIDEFAIHYNKEAVAGQILELRGCMRDDGFYMEGSAEDTPCFTGRCVFR